jgi:hypothetical protein
VTKVRRVTESRANGSGAALILPHPPAPRGVVTPAVSLIAVQVSNPGAHPLMPGRSGAWGIAFMGLALALTVHGLLRTVRVRHWRARAVPIRARVVDNAPRLSARGRTTWRPIIEYDVVGSRVLTLIPSFRSARALPLGGWIDVLYDPQDPREARPADAQVVGTSLILGLFALALFFFAIAA